MGARVTPENFRAWNEEMAGKYDQDLYYTRSPLPVRLVEWSRVRRITKMLRPSPSEVVAEVGCGAGNVLKQIPAGRLLGLDLSLRLLGKAREKCGGRARVVAANAEMLPVGGGRVDKVVCTEVLEHVLSPAKALEEIRRILRPGGIAVVSVPNERFINRVKRFLMSSRLLYRLFSGSSEYRMPEDMTEQWHLHTFDRVTLERIVPLGLEIQEVKAHPWCFLPIHYMVALRRRGGGE